MSVIGSIDTGGTFTDGHFTREGRSVRVKVETTPHDFTECFLDCVEAAATELGFHSSQAMLLETTILRFASTIATNAMIEHKGPTVGVAVSPGHEDDLYADGQRLYDIGLADRDLVTALADPTDEQSVRSALRGLLERGARVLVVSLAGGDSDPSTEFEVKRIYERAYPRHYLGAVPCLPATEVSRREDDGRRTNTAVVNAYLHPELVRALYKADEDVRSRGLRQPLLIVHGSGGVARVAKTRAIEQYNCGPAGGVHGAAVMAERYELPLALTIDMGGTSTDYSVVRDHQVPFDLDPHIEGVPVWTPLVNVDAFGCGGSSVISSGPDGLQVGPQSMGAAPGPACYGLGGTQPTPTDAHLVLGTLDPDNYLGGRRRLDPERARNALSSLADGSAEEIAWDVHRAVVDWAASHLRSELQSSEVSPEQAALFAFGGAGGLFGADVAAALGIPRVYAFAESAVFSAFGVSTMDVTHIYDLALGDGDAEAIVTELERLQQRAALDMAGEGLEDRDIVYRLEAELDDDHAELDAQPSNWRAAVDKVLDLEPRWLRLRASVPVARPRLDPEPEGDADPSSAQRGRRDVFLGGQPGQAAVFDRELLRPGMDVDGPAVIEAQDTSTLVPQGFRLHVDGYHAGIITPHGG